MKDHYRIKTAQRHFWGHKASQSIKYAQALFHSITVYITKLTPGNRRSQ